jgi:hypothetical protein
MRTSAFILMIAWLAVPSAYAGDACNPPATCSQVETCGSADHCGCCGRHGNCEKYCKIVCEMKEVKKTVWTVKCQDFCAPLPRCCNHGCCGNCEACGACNAADEATCSNDCNGKCDVCASERNKKIVPPKCGKVREKKTLEKKEVTCKVPSYKCVVVYACSHCCGQQQPAEKPAAPTPAGPAPTPAKTTMNTPMPPRLGLSSVQ